MAPSAIALIVFACVFAGALAGMLLRTRLPEDHLGESARDAIRLSMGLLATMTALVLGLVTASAKNAYDTQDDAIKHAAAKILLLDRMLANYGSETAEARTHLRAFVERRVDAIWAEDGPRRLEVVAATPLFAGQDIERSILQLTPQTDAQRWLRVQALEIGRDITEMRWLMQGELRAVVPLPFLIVVVFWLTIIFASFGLFAPRNGTVTAVLLVSALSVAAAIFLILEMGRPFEGVMQVSGAPMRYAVEHLGE